MGTITYTLPVAGSTLNAVADPEIDTALTTLLAFCNGGIDATNIAAALAQAATVNQAGQTVKGAVNIAASESRTNTAYGTLTTPDQVTGIVLPTNGLIRVWYQATWQESVSGAARAAVFVGTNQLQVQNPAHNGPTTQAGATGAAGPTGITYPLITWAGGLISMSSAGSQAADVATGQAVAMAGLGTFAQELAGSVDAATFRNTGGPCDISVAAGTYTLAIMFKASSGSVTASNRKLWVQALSFA